MSRKILVKWKVSWNQVEAGLWPASLDWIVEKVSVACPDSIAVSLFSNSRIQIAVRRASLSMHAGLRALGADDQTIQPFPGICDGEFWQNSNHSTTRG